jgi:MoaA/NifB/PqqE/SkfB family radical SAM enzyme
MSVLHYSLPPILQLETTTACNLGCPSCLRKIFCGSDEYLNFERFCEIIDGTGCRYVTLHGWGEPLMNTELVEMIRYASGHRKLVNFTTNASLIFDKTEDLLGSGLDAIAFSLPDINRCTPEIAENISQFMKMRAVNGQTRPKTYINISLLRENFDQTGEMLVMAKAFGVDTVVFERSYPWTDDLRSAEASLFGKIRVDAARSGCKVRLPGAHTTPCQLMNYTLFVRYNGDVAPCCYRADEVLGNVFSDSITRIIRNRVSFFKKMKTDPICSVCRV